MNIPVIAVIGVFLLIMLRRIGNWHFELWQAMLLGVAAVLLTGQITPGAALGAIDADVMLFPIRGVCRWLGLGTERLPVSSFLQDV